MKKNSRAKILPLNNFNKNKRTIFTLLGIIITIFIVMAVRNNLILAQNTLAHKQPAAKAGLAYPRERASCTGTLPQKDLKKPTDYSRSFTKTDCTFGTYSSTPIKIKELDRNTCRRISSYVIVDKNHVYKQLYDRGSSDYGTYTIIKEADPKTFTFVSSLYYKDTSHLFFDTGDGYKIIQNIDFPSTQVLSTHYLKDKNHVYFNKSYGDDAQQRILPGFDVNTFRVVQNSSNHEGYFVDKNGVYVDKSLGTLNADTSKIVDADRDTFMVLEEYGMAKDKNHVYYGGKVVPNVDAPTFEVLNGTYFRDAYSIYSDQYSGFQPLRGSDVCTFELIGYKKDDWSGYAKDKNTVYYRDTPLEGSDPASFQVLERDANGLQKAFDKYREYQGKYRK